VRRVEVRAETDAQVFVVRCAVGAAVAAGDELIVLESMKMEIPVEAPVAGVVRELRVAVDARVREGDVLVVLEAAG
jgi:acetyl-CoA carboxylase biotin carboxyl carrier protein